MKGEDVAIPSKTALAIHVITANFAGSRSVISVPDVKWSKPAQNLYKVNVDACFMEDGSGATAAVLRNHWMRLLLGQQISLRMCLMPLQRKLWR